MLESMEMLEVRGWGKVLMKPSFRHCEQGEAIHPHFITFNFITPFFPLNEKKVV